MTDSTNPIFLEEPEAHLYPGAQRYLLERLSGGKRQVFLTTHSPILVNVGQPSILYQVAQYEGRTRVTRIKGSDSPAATLEDIGARNSDVLLSDAVLFVEGPSDARALTAWSETLGNPLTLSNVSLLPMGGGEHIGRGAPARSELLADLSQKAPIPHLFVVDRDERSDAEIAQLERQLEGRCVVLERREIENYMLIPRALKAALIEKCRDNPDRLRPIEAASEAEIATLIEKEAEGLYGRVLIKRIRGDIPGLRGGLFSRELVAELLPMVGESDLADRIRSALHGRINDHLAGVDFDAIVESQKQRLDEEWSDRGRRLWLVPGEEVLSAVFPHFGTEYAKPKDTALIAAAMHRGEIDPEITRIIGRAMKLAKDEPLAIGPERSDQRAQARSDANSLSTAFTDF